MYIQYIYIYVYLSTVVECFGGSTLDRCLAGNLTVWCRIRSQSVHHTTAHVMFAPNKCSCDEICGWKLRSSVSCRHV